jgi:hypothetical protein
MSSTLELKIAARSGRLQLIVAAMAKLSRTLINAPDEMDEAVEPLHDLAIEFGPSWLDEAAMLLKEMYNRRQGP